MVLWMGEPLAIPGGTPGAASATSANPELSSFTSGDLLTTWQETQWGQNRLGAANNLLEIAEMGTTGSVSRFQS